MASVLTEYLLLPPSAFMDHGKQGVGAVDVEVDFERVEDSLPAAKRALYGTRGGQHVLPSRAACVRTFVVYISP